MEETARGLSGRAIVGGLNRDGIPSPTGGAWSDSTLRGNVTRGEGILRNRLYLGEARYGRNETSFDPDTGAKRVFSTPEKAIIKIIPEMRIISDELWEAAQAAMVKSAGKVATGGNPRAARRPTILLSGLLVCGHCGQQITKQGNNYFRCRGARNQTCAVPPSIRQSVIEQRIFARLTPMLLSPDFEDRFDNALKAARDAFAGPSAQDRLSAVKRRRTATQRKATLKRFEINLNHEFVLKRPQHRWVSRVSGLDRVST